MKILLLCAKAFETMEFSAFVDVMGWAHDNFQCDVEVETCGFNKTVISTFGIPITVDKLIDDIRNVAFKLLEMLTSEEKMKLVKEAMGY